MTTTAVASTLPVSVLCTGTTHTVGIPPYEIGIEGTRSPDAINGIGITYNVDSTALGEWLAGQPEVALQVSAVTQGQLDALAAQEGQYGYELGLIPPGTLEAEGVFAIDPFGMTERQELQAATVRLREAQKNEHELEQNRKMLDAASGPISKEREDAEQAARAAAEKVAKRQEEIQARLDEVAQQRERQHAERRSDGGIDVSAEQRARAGHEGRDELTA